MTYQTALSWFWECTLMDIICVDFVVQIKLSNTLTNIWWYFGRLRCPEKLETKTLEARLWCTFVLVHHAEDLCINNLWIYSKPTWHQKCTQRSIFSNVFLLVDIFRAELRECFEMGLPFPKVVVRACVEILQTFCTPRLSTMLWLGSPLIISHSFWLFLLGYQILCCICMATITHVFLQTG